MFGLYFGDWKIENWTEKCKSKKNYLHKAIVMFSVLVFIPFFMHSNSFIY